MFIGFEMGTNNCKLYNDTDYKVTIVDYDGTRTLKPGFETSNYLLKGSYYLKLVMEFPDGWKEGIAYLYGSEFEGRTHRMSNLFHDQIHEYTNNHIPTNMKVTRSFSKWHLLHKHPGGFQQEVEVEKVETNSWKRMRASETVSEVKIGFMLDALSQSTSFRQSSRLSSTQQFEQQTKQKEKRTFKDRCCLWQEIIVVETNQQPPFQSIEIPTNNIEMTVDGMPTKSKFLPL